MSLKSKLIFLGAVIGTAVALNIGWGYLSDRYFKSGRVGDYEFNSGIAISTQGIGRKVAFTHREADGSLVRVYDYDKDGNLDSLEVENVQQGNPLEQLVNLQKAQELYTQARNQ